LQVFGVCNFWDVADAVVGAHAAAIVNVAHLLKRVAKVKNHPIVNRPLSKEV
jgi:hypothetical protein